METHDGVVITKVRIPDSKSEYEDGSTWVVFDASNGKSYSGVLTLINPFDMAAFVILKMVATKNQDPRYPNDYKFEEKNVSFTHRPLTVGLLGRAYQVYARGNEVDYNTCVTKVKSYINDVIKQNNGLSEHLGPPSDKNNMKVGDKVILSSGILSAITTGVGYYLPRNTMGASRSIYETEFQFATQKQIIEMTTKFQRNPMDLFFEITKPRGFSRLGAQDVKRVEEMARIRFSKESIFSINVYDRIMKKMGDEKCSAIRESYIIHFLTNFFRDDIRNMQSTSASSSAGDDESRSYAVISEEIGRLCEMGVMKRVLMTDPEAMDSKDHFLIDAWVAHNEEIIMPIFKRLIRVPMESLFPLKALDHVMLTSHLSHLSFDQRVALCMGLSEGLLIITGLAGGGKSYIELLILLIISRVYPDEVCILITPTGVSCEGLYQRALEIAKMPNIRALLEELNQYKVKGGEEAQKELEYKLLEGVSLKNTHNAFTPLDDEDNKQILSQWITILGDREKAIKTLKPPFKRDTTDETEKRLLEQYVAMWINPDTPISVAEEGLRILTGYLGPSSSTIVERVRNKMYPGNNGNRHKKDKGKETKKEEESSDEDDDLIQSIDDSVLNEDLNDLIVMDGESAMSSSSSSSSSTKKKGGKKSKRDWVAIEMSEVLGEKIPERKEVQKGESGEGENFKMLGKNLIITTAQFIIYRHNHDNLPDWIPKVRRMMIDEQMLDMGQMTELHSIFPLSQSVFVGDPSQMQTMSVGNLMASLIAALETYLPELKRPPETLGEICTTRFLTRLLINQRVLSYITNTTKKSNHSDKENEDKIALIEGIRGILQNKIPQERDGVIELIDVESELRDVNARKTFPIGTEEMWINIIANIKRAHRKKDVLFVTNTHYLEKRVNDIVSFIGSPLNPEKKAPKPGEVIRRLIYPGMRIMVNRKVKGPFGHVFTNGYMGRIRELFCPLAFKNKTSKNKADLIKGQQLDLCAFVDLEDYERWKMYRVLMEDGNILDLCNFPMRAIEMAEAITVRRVQGKTVENTVVCLPVIGNSNDNNYASFSDGKFKVFPMGKDVIYTMMSRASSKLIIVGAEQIDIHISKDYSVSRYNRITNDFDFDGQMFEKPRFITGLLSARVDEYKRLLSYRDVSAQSPKKRKRKTEESDHESESASSSKTHHKKAKASSSSSNDNDNTSPPVKKGKRKERDEGDHHPLFLILEDSHTPKKIKPCDDDE